MNVGIAQFFQTLKRKLGTSITKPIRVRPGGYAPSNRVSGKNLYPGARSSLSKQPHVKYIP